MSVAPVTNEASWHARNRMGYATSRGSAQRPSRLSRVRSPRSAVSETPRAAARRMGHGVMVPPGHTALTRTRCGASSTASARVKPSTAALVVSYWPMPVRPISPYTDDTLTMVPRPVLRIRGSAALRQLAVPSTLKPMIRSQSAASASASGADTRTPATFTRVWSPPRCAAVSSTMRAASASWVTSPTSGSSVAPGTAARMASAARATASPSASSRATAAPSSAKSRPVASPMPPPPPVTSATRPAMNPGIGAASDERELVPRPHQHPRAGTVHPALARGQHHGGGADQEGARVRAGGGRAVLAEGAGGRHHAPAHLDDRGVAAAEALLTAVDDVTLALLHRLVLYPEAGDPAVHPGAVDLPVHEVVVLAVRRGAHVAVGLGGGRRVVADVRALALDVELDLLRRQLAVRVPGHHPVHHVGAVHRHPDVRLHDPLVEVGGRHRVEREQELGDAPVPAAVRVGPTGADQHSVVGVDHLEARGSVAGGDGRPDPEAHAGHG